MFLISIISNRLTIFISLSLILQNGMQFRSALWKNNLGSFCSATTRLKVEAQGSNSLRNDEAMLCKCGESINMCHRNSHLSGLPIIIVLFHACVEDNFTHSWKVCSSRSILMGLSGAAQ